MVPPQQIVYKKTYYQGGDLKTEEPIVLPAQFPTFQGFANSIGVNTDTVVEWVKVYPDFSVAYTRAKQIQEDIWLKNAMGNQYNAQFAKFFGTNCLGYKERQEVDLDADLNVNIRVID